MAEMKSVTGTATYRERMALPPDAMLHVALLDVSLQDAAALELASASYDLGGVPAAFRLDYDADDIDDRMTYAVRAWITVGERLMFTTTMHYPVLTRGEGDHVDVVMERVSGDPHTSLEGTEWVVTDMQGVPVASDRPPTLAFLAEGGVAAFGGCNRFVGSGSAMDGRVQIADALAGTRMACIDDVARMEREFIDLLHSVDRYIVQDESLILSDAAGAEVIRLRQSE